MIILHAKGQTCNKFFIYLGFFGDSIESGEKIVVLSPDITIRDYPNLTDSHILKFPFYSVRIANFIGYKTYINSLNIIFGNKIIVKVLFVFFKFIPGIKFLVVASGDHKSKNHLQYAVEFKKLFIPNITVISEVDNVFQNFRTQAEIICGVHIRYRDYKYFKGGKYFYQLEEYHSLMLNIKNLFFNYSVAFFISSDEKIDLSAFTDCNCFRIPNVNSTKDLYGLSCCNYIIGPPSTFSGWASYYNNIPIYFIENPDEEITLSSFKHIFEIWE